MRVLLSIKPKYAEAIFNGSKKFEYRRIIFKNENIKTVVVYASSPISKVIGEFEIERILTDKPRCLWENTKEYSGVTQEFFDDYFADKDLGYAIKIKKAVRYANERCLVKEYNLKPPQSFLYLI